MVLQIRGPMVLKTDRPFAQDVEVNRAPALELLNPAVRPDLAPDTVQEPVQVRLGALDQQPVAGGDLFAVALVHASVVGEREVDREVHGRVGENPAEAPAALWREARDGSARAAARWKRRREVSDPQRIPPAVPPIHVQAQRRGYTRGIRTPPPRPPGTATSRHAPSMLAALLPNPLTASPIRLRAIRTSGAQSMTAAVGRQGDFSPTNKKPVGCPLLSSAGQRLEDIRYFTKGPHARPFHRGYSEASMMDP